MLGPLDRTYGCYSESGHCTYGIPPTHYHLKEVAELFISKPDLPALASDLLPQQGSLDLPLWGMKFQRWDALTCSCRSQLFSQSSHLPKVLASHAEWQKLALGKCLYPPLLGCLTAHIYIGKVLSVNTKERQILTGATEHIKDLGYKEGLYFPKLINSKGVVLFLNITYWNRKLPRWVT